MSCVWRNTAVRFCPQPNHDSSSDLDTRRAPCYPEIDRFSRL